MKRSRSRSPEDVAARFTLELGDGRTVSASEQNSACEAIGLTPTIAGEALTWLVRREPSVELAIDAKEALLKCWVTLQKDPDTVEGQKEFIDEFVVHQGKLLCRPYGALRMLAEHFALRINYWEPDGSALLFAVPGPKTGRSMDVAISFSVWTRFYSDEAREKAMDVEMQRAHRTQLEVRMYGGTSDMDEAALWQASFAQLKEVGIAHLIARYEKVCEQALPVAFPDSDGNERDAEAEYHYEYRPNKDDNDQWERYVLIEGCPLIKEIRGGVKALRKLCTGRGIPFAKKDSAESLLLRLISIRSHGPALLFRAYLSRIGGNNELPETLGDDCLPVELFHFFMADRDLGWFPLQIITARLFPREALSVFLHRDFDEMQSAFTGLIGQREARADLVNKIIVPAVRALLDAGRPLLVKEYNLTFAGPPGTGKTTIAPQVSRIMYYAGMLPLDYCEITTGAKLGSGTGNADQGALCAKRYFQRARGGVLFIDELPGITDEQPTANQSAAVSAVVAEVLQGRCCTIGAGYADALEKRFFSRDAGLHRRFKDVKFVDFTDHELYQIFCIKAGGLESLQRTFTPKAIAALMWMQAFVSAPGENGSFAERLRACLSEAVAAADMRAPLLGRDGVPAKHDVMAVLVAWAKKIAHPLQYRPICAWIDDVVLELERDPDEFNCVRDFKRRTFARQILIALGCPVGMPLPPLDGVPFDCSIASDGQGVLELLLALLPRVAGLQERVFVEDTSAQGRQVSVQLVRACSLDVAAGAIAALSVVDGTFWTRDDEGTDQRPRTCLLFRNMESSGPDDGDDGSREERAAAHDAHVIIKKEETSVQPTDHGMGIDARAVASESVPSGVPDIVKPLADLSSTTKAIDAQSEILAFVAHRCGVKAGTKISFASFYNLYKDWAARNNRPTVHTATMVGIVLKDSSKLKGDDGQIYVKNIYFK